MDCSASGYQNSIRECSGISNLARSKIQLAMDWGSGLLYHLSFRKVQRKMSRKKQGI